MSMNWQVSSLEWSRKLKELGVVQDSIFYWMQNEKWDWYLSFRPTKSTYPDVSGGVSAFTVAELGFLLPSYVQSPPGVYVEVESIKTERKGGHFECWFIEHEPKKNGVVLSCTRSFEDATEANARSAMLCHLLENKIISLEKVNERLRRVR